jgi:predicted MPP superfamily phosphohydrolase
MKLKILKWNTMKRLILTLAVVLPMAVLAQKKPVDKLFEKYANKEGFTTVNISGKLLGFASQMETGDEAADEMLSKLNREAGFF